MADALSIQETNKLRISLGLKPLPVPGGGNISGLIFKDTDEAAPPAEDLGSTLESRQAEGYENFKKLREEAEAKAKRAAKNDAIKRARDAARRFAKLEGKGLGDEDPESALDTRSWLLQQKKRQKKLEKARKLEQELAEREQQAEYTSADLAGLKVAHGMGEIEQGEDQVLTLKDTTIDENEEEGDELENLELKEREVLSERLELKKKKPVYNPNDLEDGGPVSILRHYDEEIDGKKRDKFTLDGQGNIADVDGKLSKAGKADGLGPKLFSLDFDGIVGPPISDYQDAPEIKLKKSRQKKAKNARRRAADDDDVVPPTADPTNVDHSASEQNTMDIDSMPTTVPSQKRSYDTSSLLDDDDLQAALAAQRRVALKKRKKLKPEDIARQVREEAASAATPDATEFGPADDGAEAGLIIDETSEFVANLQKPSTDGFDRRQQRRQSSSKPIISTNDQPDSDIDMSPPPAQQSETPLSTLPTTGLDEEATLNQGIGATLTLLTSRGIIPAPNLASASQLNEHDRARSAFLLSKSLRLSEAEQRARLARERDRSSGLLATMSAREREAHAQHENKVRDQYESRQLQDVFAKEYRPNVELRYTDEDGREMDKKEAFKHLSHAFHGKGSGKGKLEKRIKKLESEKRQMGKGILAAESGGLAEISKGEGRKTGSAGVRLG